MMSTNIKTVPGWIKDFSFIIVSVAGGVWTLHKIVNATKNHWVAKKSKQDL